MTLARFTYYPEEAQCRTAADDNSDAARPRLDGQAFDAAVGAFHRAYFHAYKPSVPSEHDEAHQEALREALEGFLWAYEAAR